MATYDDNTPAPILVELNELRRKNAELMKENVRLTTENESLNEKVLDVISLTNIRANVIEVQDKKLEDMRAKLNDAESKITKEHDDFLISCALADDRLEYRKMGESHNDLRKRAIDKHIIEEHPVSHCTSNEWMIKQTILKISVDVDVESDNDKPGDDVERESHEHCFIFEPYTIKIGNEHEFDVKVITPNNSMLIEFSKPGSSDVSITVRIDQVIENSTGYQRAEGCKSKNE